MDMKCYLCKNIMDILHEGCRDNDKINKTYHLILDEQDKCDTLWVELNKGASV